MLHIIIGLFFIALGVWGIFDEWYYVIDCAKAGISAILTLGGLFGILAGLVPPKPSLPDTESATDPQSISECEDGAP